MKFLQLESKTFAMKNDMEMENVKLNKTKNHFMK